MPFGIGFAARGRDDLRKLEENPADAKRPKAVRAALGKLQSNPRHPRLNTHKYTTMHGENGEEVLEAYAENNTPGAYRIFWHYGPGKDVITIIAITPHL
jgi:hypothetical protein